jgi:hypothetical protein
VYNGSFHLDSYAHPGVDAALKKMLALRQARELAMAALQDSGSGHREIRKASRAFGNRWLASVEVGYEAAAKMRNLGEGVRLAALVNHTEGCAFLDMYNVRFEVPVRVRSPSSCFRKEVAELCGCPNGDVLLEVRSKRGIEGGRITLIQGHDLYDTRCLLVLWIEFLISIQGSSTRSTNKDSGKHQPGESHGCACNFESVSGCHFILLSGSLRKSTRGEVQNIGGNVAEILPREFRRVKQKYGYFLKCETSVRRISGK